MSYFCPAELICAHLGISRGSFYRSLKELLALGLVDARGHKTTINGWAVRCDGTLWSVKLLPHKGSRARLRLEDLKAQYRDLEADIEAGNTAYAQTRQSSIGENNAVTLESLLAWALPPTYTRNPVTLTVAPEERGSASSRSMGWRPSLWPSPSLCSRPGGAGPASTPRRRTT